MGSNPILPVLFLKGFVIGKYKKKKEIVEMRTYNYSYEITEDFKIIPERFSVYYWFCFIVLIDFFLPFFFDPFQVQGLNFIFDIIIDFDDLFLIFLIFIFPLFFVFYYDSSAGYGYFVAVFIYVFFFNWILHILYCMFTEDGIYSILFILIIVDYLMFDGEEEIGEEDYL